MRWLMRRLRQLLGLALVFGASVAWAERPVWELQVRMDGGGHQMGKLMAGALFEPMMGGADVLGKETVLRMAGDEDGGWVVSADGDLSAEQLMEQVREKGGVERVSGEVRVLALKSPDEVMEFFSPRRDQLTVTGGGMAPGLGMELLKDLEDKPSSGQWIRGGVDFRRLGEDAAKSTLLRRVKEIRFSLDISEAGVLELQARGDFDQEQTAKRSLRIADGLVALLSATGEGEQPLDERVKLTLKDTSLVLEAEILPTEVAKLVNEVKREWGRLATEREEGFGLKH